MAYALEKEKKKKKGKLHKILLSLAIQILYQYAIRAFQRSGRRSKRHP